MNALLKTMRFAAALGVVTAAAFHPQPASAQWYFNGAQWVWIETQAAAVNACARYCGTDPSRLAGTVVRTYTNAPRYARTLAEVGGPLRYQTTPRYIPPQYRVVQLQPGYRNSTPQAVYYYRP